MRDLGETATITLNEMQATLRVYEGNQVKPKEDQEWGRWTGSDLMQKMETNDTEQRRDIVAGLPRRRRNVPMQLSHKICKTLVIDSRWCFEPTF